MTTPKVFRLTADRASVAELLRRVYRAGVESRHGCYAETEETAAVIAKVAEILTSPENTGKFGMMLSGLSGNGKTTMLQAIAAVIRLGKANGFCDPSFGTLGIYDADVVLKIAATEEWGRFKDTPLLAIDDFGKESTEVASYGNISSPMIELLEYRYRKMLYTAINTNLNPKEVKSKYGQRIADRFNEMLDVVILKGDSYRGKNKNQK